MKNVLLPAEAQYRWPLATFRTRLSITGIVVQLASSQCSFRLGEPGPRAIIAGDVVARWPPRCCVPAGVLLPLLWSLRPLGSVIRILARRQVFLSTADFQVDLGGGLERGVRFLRYQWLRDYS